MKTALQQLISILEKRVKPHSNKDFVTGLSFAIKCANDLLDDEKLLLCDFWIEGNKQGWGMQTDWPEDAENYYHNKFEVSSGSNAV